MSSSHSPKQSHLLAALPAADYARLLPELELIPMGLGEVLYEPGVKLRHVYLHWVLVSAQRTKDFGHRPTAQRKPCAHH
jgi:hypothetical protein